MCLYLDYCENNPVIFMDYYGYWAQNYSGFRRKGNDFFVNMNKKFLSRAFCLAYAADVISRYGKWSWHGKLYGGMGIKRIAVELYADAIGYYVGSTLNYINKSWGKGLINSGKEIHVNKSDHRTWKFYAVWSAGSIIKWNWRVRAKLPYYHWVLM